ncbi:MAG: type 4a pilus biogenesis protein PilO [Sulfuriflexus sp.]|nr:type 4a pilus biogenesis protein PilO [Sulfuriflexus sp.]
MNISELNELDFDDMGNWPIAAKALGIAVICLAVLGGGYWFDTKDQLAELERIEQTERKLKAEFKSNARKAANIELYKQQMIDMKQSFGAMLKQLPSQTEVAELLVDISQTGLASGLEFDLFKVDNEVPLDFYAELPIRIRVTGDYHEFGSFVSGVAALPRIVTLHDFSIKDSKENGQLIMEATAKTYRYIDEETDTPDNGGAK